MEAPRVLVCLPPDDEAAAPLLAEAAGLAGGLRAPLSVVFLYPAGWTGPLRENPRAWHLMTDAPEPAIRRFAARQRFTHIVHKEWAVRDSNPGCRR